MDQTRLALYEAAKEFRKLACWEWMDEEQIFGVMDPDTGEVGYCCVLGNAGEVFALAVYPGTEGLQSYFQLKDGFVDGDPIFTQKCLMVTFDNREDLDSHDLKEIKELGVKFRGKKQWPIFRKFEPGYFPWSLEKEEIRYMVFALQQAILIGKRMKENPAILQPIDGKAYLTRVSPDRGKTWIDQWVQPLPIPQSKEVAHSPYKFLIHRVKNEIMNVSGVWATDIFYLPEPVQDEEGQRPYFPLVNLWIDVESQMIVHFHLGDKGGDMETFQIAFLHMLTQLQTCPELILVEREDTYALFAPIADELGIKIHRQEVLELIEDAREGLIQSILQRNEGI